MFSIAIDRRVQPAAGKFGRGRAGVKVDCIVLHHGATTSLSGLLGLMTGGSRVVSSTYVVGNAGEIVGVVSEQDTPYTNGHLGRNRRSVTVETVNETAAPGWTISAAAHESLARIVASVAAAYGFPINADTVLPHRDLYTRFREGYATACPGGMDVARIIARAQELSKPAPILNQEGDMPRIYHQVNTDGNQAYIVEGNFGFDIVSTEQAKSFCKALGIAFAAIPRINEVDYAALNEAKKRDVTRLTGILAALPQGEVSAAQVARLVEDSLKDDFAAVQKAIDDQPTEFTVSPKQ